MCWVTMMSGPPTTMESISCGIEAEIAGDIGQRVQRGVKQPAAGIGLVADAVDLRSVGVGAVEPLGIGVGAEVC